jgi:hypothetical protein
MVARAGGLLRELEQATTTLTDVLDVTGFPREERQKEVALLSRLASGLPPITLEDVIEALRTLVMTTGPAALFGEDPGVSLPDEARELLYIVEPLATLAQGNRRLPRHAGARISGAGLAFSLGQPRTTAALAVVVTLLDELMRLPLGRPELTTIRQPRLPRQPTQPRVQRVQRREPTLLAEAILLVALLLALAGAVAIALVVSGTPMPSL